VDVQRASFLVYSVVAAVLALTYLRLSARNHRAAADARSAPLRKSRRIVLELTALFSLDAFGGGFVVQAMLALWLFERFDVAVGTAGLVFFVAGLLSASSQLASPWLASRIGLVRTMAFTHIPANVLLVLAALMPSAGLAIACLLARMLFSSMDVPARQSYTMAMVPPEERAAAASVTNVPRSLASALAPLLAGAMLSVSSFGWPLICGGAIKVVYDVLLLRLFAARRPPGELAATR
jgi:predicted MFS family arabinose efflux permease